VLRELIHHDWLTTKEESGGFFGATKGGRGDRGSAHIEAMTEQTFTEDGAIRTGRCHAIHGETRITELLIMGDTFISEMIRT
jgi:hypothetical protein